VQTPLSQLYANEMNIHLENCQQQHLRADGAIAKSNSASAFGDCEKNFIFRKSKVIEILNNRLAFN
jgi:hypothetical protein